MRKYQPAIILIAITLLIVIIFGSQMFYIVQPGERGLIFRKFTSGLDKENLFIPGFHIVAPWNDFHIYDVKEQKSEETMDILDKNGLSINVDVSIRYFPTHDRIGDLHESFGKNYAGVLVIPELRSAVRKVMGRFTAEEIYSTKRTEVERAIEEETAEVLKRNFIDMRALLIRSINLPEQIREAIENKLKTEQEALAYQFRLDREKSEAERRRIAAEGEARANMIINNSLTTNLLKMRGIEATIELAKSPNAKVVVIGSGKDGMPIILGGN